MDTVAETNGVSKDVTDLYGNPFHTTLAEVVEHLSHAPYWHVDEKAPARLVRAAQLIRQSRVQLHDSHRATVYGTTRSYDLDGYACTCPASQKGTTHWCVHAVTVKLARTLEERMAQNPTLPLGPVTVDDRLAQAVSAPIALGTLRAGTLPLPPVTVDERLALGTMPDHTALSTSHVPREDGYDGTQEELMASDEADDAQYIPEPNVPPVAVLDAPERKEERKEGPRPLPGPVLLPSLDARTLEQSMQAYAAQRAVVTRYIKEQMTEGVDYYTLTIKGRVSKATLSKAGSEKFLSLFQLSAQFQQDEATWRMLGSKDGLLCYTCMLMTRSGEVIGEGRGARSVSQDGGDINKAIKMATKSAQVDAVLRTGALSDVFTQDFEPETAPEPVKAAPAQPTAQSQDLRKRIWAQVNRQAPHIKTQDDAEAWVQERTGLAMEPAHYEAIAAKLGA